MMALGLALAFANCHRSSTTESRHYEARGIIRGFSPDRSTVEVQHEDIPGFMPSMTMPFQVRDRRVLADFNIGEAISFRLSVTDRDAWIDQIKRINADEVHLPAPSGAPSLKVAESASLRLHEGDVMPPFQLTDQNGHALKLESFRGHPLVLTFIFTRCPIPNFCPLMSKNFFELQKLIKNGSGVLARTRLLSVSFDPGFDSPQVLKEYAQHEQADFSVWTFATGSKSEIDGLTQAFSVYVQPEGGTISHGLATALIDRDGNVARIWRGNGWKPSEVIAAIEAKKN